MSGPGIAGIYCRFRKGSADFLHPAPVLPQVGIAEAGGGAELDDPPLPVQEEFPVVDEEPGPELHPQVALRGLDDSRIAAPCKELLQAGKCGIRLVAEREGGDPVPFIACLA